MANPKQYNSQTKHYQTSNQTKELTTPKAGQKKFSLRKFIIAVLVLILLIGVVPPIVHWVTNFLPITQTKEKTTSSAPAKYQPNPSLNVNKNQSRSPKHNRIIPI